MLKNFYSLPWLVKLIILLPLVICGLIFLMYFLDTGYGYFVLPLLLPIGGFAILPMCRLFNMATYLSPMVMTFGKDVNDYQLHNCQTFDYLVNFKWSERGHKAKRKMLGFYMEALLSIIEKIETDELPESVVVVGNSYFFNERTASKLGFKVEKGSAYRALNSIINCFEIACLYSFTEGKLKFPNLWTIKKASVAGSTLLEKKEQILKIHSLLTRPDS